MTKGKGYLLPSGDATEDELECCLVFYPARDEYRRALMGSLDYLATWIAWERDSEKRGQDAAASWKLANIQTWECCSMGFCDDLATTLQQLLAATLALECCGDQDITDGEQYTDEIEDGVGDVPQNIIDAGYADDAADWDGFATYKCMISHLAVDHIESFFREIAPHISDTGIVIGGIGVVGALIGAILTVAGLPISAGIIIALGAAAAIWTWITSEGRDAVEDLADEIATHHDALACAIYFGDGVTDSISDFNDEVDSLFNVIDAVAIKALGFEPQLRALYSGRYDQEDIAQSLADKGYDVVNYDCSTCDEDPPPAGYHLEYPDTMTFYSDSGCNNDGSTYDPVTGIATLKMTVSSSTWTIGFTFTGGIYNWSSLGAVINLISVSGATPHPSDQRIKAENMTGQVSLETAELLIGNTWGQYNIDQFSGSAWDDWVEQFDYYGESFSDPGSRQFWWLSSIGNGQATDHEVKFRIRMIVPD